MLKTEKPCELAPCFPSPSYDLCGFFPIRLDTQIAHMILITSKLETPLLHLLSPLINFEPTLQ